MSAWPETLPQIPLVDGYSEASANNVLATAMDIGPAKRRLRGTVAPRPISMSFYLDSTQVGTFDTFFVTTTHYGVDSFTFPLPPSGTSTSVHFTPGSLPRKVPQGIGVILSIWIEVDL